jgi:diguanylate cyclase (GGDEF)-like protein
MNTKILVIDDTRLNIKLLTEILEDEGYDVYSASDGYTAIDIVREIMPDIILLDIMMPGIDGFEVCKLLKQDYDLKDIPVIMVTAKTDSSDLKKALELGAFDYIKKPVDEDEVIARVQSALRFKSYQDMLKEAAVKDALTGLYNHGLLIEMLEKEIASADRKNTGICFIMIDIDLFKDINDTYGHMAGDSVLRELSFVLSKSVRIGDTVGRYGGEEFGIILPDVKYEDIYPLCERIRENVFNNKFYADDNIIHVTTSIGACYKDPKVNMTVNEVIKAADDALYSAKNIGRNKAVVYTNTIP